MCEALLKRSQYDSSFPHFICSAITESYNIGMIRKRDANVGIKYVTRAIGGHTSIVHWLRSRGVDVSNLPHNQVQQHRLDWIDNTLNNLEQPLI